MVICSISDPAHNDEWQHDMCQLRRLDAIPPQSRIDLPHWSETKIERALLQSPEIIADALGVENRTNLLVLRQVDEIDLYVRADGELHLIEVKRPSSHTSRAWRSAVSQVIGYWRKNKVWLRTGTQRVHLWAMCPARWSSKTALPKIPTGWEAELKNQEAAELSGEGVATLHFLHYALLKHDRGRTLIMWRSDEEPLVLPH
jgi:hypothetical protein